ncbi:MAG TPA: metalloprotease [Salinimicrobium sp.]|nr:metalloprotease [Salinimicrobium sp.]
MKKKLFVVFIICLLGSTKIFAQHDVELNVIVDTITKTLHVEQKVLFQNTSADTLSEIYFHDWNNSFQSTVSPLGKRFSEDFIRRFHFAKEEDRGATVINAIWDNRGDNIDWERPEDAPDIILLKLKKPLLPGEEIELNFSYGLILPSDKFTGYGYNNDGNFKLQYWYVTPAVYKEKWHIYSNKNLDDLFVPKMDINMTLEVPEGFEIATALDIENINPGPFGRKIGLSGKDVMDTKLFMFKNNEFEIFQTRDLALISNLKDAGLNQYMKVLTIARIFEFLEKHLGPYPHEKIMVTKEEYQSNPVYGLNQLPEFIRPFPDGFQYDIKQLKTIIDNYLETTLLLNPRKDRWVHDAIHIYLMIEYVNTYYPEMKIFGSLSEFFGLRWTHAADLKFNDQYPMLYLHMARKNMDQPLTTSRDSLVGFNKNIGNAYKAGTGLVYLQDFLEEENVVLKSIKEFYKKYELQQVNPEDFQKILEKNAPKNIDWFFEDFVATKTKMDFTFGKVKATPDSLIVTIENKENNNMPVSLYGINEGRVVFKKWVENVNPERTVVIPREGIERLALNYDLEIPEVNPRNNFDGIDALLNKPIQFRLFQDIEDPRYTQIFFMPEFDYNLYDGAVLGAKIYNKTFLKKNFNYNISPKWGFNSQTLVGSASIFQSFQLDHSNLFTIDIGASGSRYSYGYGLFYKTFTPFLSLNFREPNLRDNERQSLSISSVNVYRDTAEDIVVEHPNYNVLSIKYNFSNPSLVNYLTSTTDFQLSKGFSKLSFSFDYRKLFLNNRQINIRFFAGTFIYNDMDDSDYFSFALDRPTDYLFEHNYYGRSESSGLFSQQIIMAEGGFKSQLQPEYANQWLTTVNASTNIWKWIYAYGDVGFVKNKHFDAELLYDSGIRLSLIADYFEVFFPIYSSLGWEIGAENYDQRIRFIATLSLNTLTKLFTRRWY